MSCIYAYGKFYVYLFIIYLFFKLTIQNLVLIPIYLNNILYPSPPTLCIRIELGWGGMNDTLLSPSPPFFFSLCVVISKVLLFTEVSRLIHTYNAVYIKIHMQVHLSFCIHSS